MNDLTIESTAIARLSPLKRGFPGFAHAPLTHAGTPSYLITCARFIAEANPNGARELAELAQHIAVETGDQRTKRALARATADTDTQIARLPRPEHTRAALRALTTTLAQAQLDTRTDELPLAVASAVGRTLTKSPKQQRHLLTRLLGDAPFAASALSHCAALHRALADARPSSNQQRRALLTLPGLIATHLRAACLNARNPLSARLSALSPNIQDAVSALATERTGSDLWRQLEARFASPRPVDSAHVFAPISSYPFNLAEPHFFNDRNSYTHSSPGSNTFRRASNPATLEWLETNPAIVPVLCSREGSILEDTASARLYAAHLRAHPAATIAHTVCAAWDAEHGLAKAYPLTHSVAGWLEAAARHRPGTTPPDIGFPMPPPDQRPLDDPEQITLTPAPGQPVFVIVPPPDLAPVLHDQSQALYAVPTVAGKNAPRGVHPHSLALTVAARLGGPRDVALLSREHTQGPLFTTTDQYHAAISLPVHHCAIALLAQGAGHTRVLLHAGAPWEPRQPLTRITPRSTGRYHDIAQDPDIRAHFAARAAAPAKRNEERPAHEQLFAWLHRMTDRPDTQRWRHPGPLPTETVLVSPATAQPRRHQKNYHLGEDRPVLRIAVLVNPDEPDELRHCIRLMRHSKPLFGYDDHDYLIPQPLWQAPSAAQTLRDCVREHYPYGLTDVGARKTPPHSARLHVVTAADITPDNCDLVLIGSLQPKNPHHHSLLSALSRSAHQPVARIAIAPSKLTHPRTKAIVWGTPADRAERWHLLGARALSQSTAHPDTALLLAATARAQHLDTLIVTTPLPLLDPHPPHRYGPLHYDPAHPEIRQAYDPLVERLAPLYDRQPATDALRRPPATVPARLAHRSVDPHNLHRAPVTPDTQIAHRVVQLTATEGRLLTA